MFPVSVSSFQLFLLVTLTALPIVTCHSSVIQCRCNKNRERRAALLIACSKSKNLEGTPQCNKDYVQDVPEGYEYLEPWGLYKLYRTHMTRDAARAMCSRHLGRLAIPRDNRSAAVLGRLVKEEPGVEVAFVGIYSGGLGLFSNEDVTHATYKVWRNGEPREERTCVAMTDDGRLDGLMCDVPAPFICERVQSSALPPGYRYVPNASAFLRLFTAEKAVYRTAQKICEEDFGKLAVPDTWLRAEAMLRLIPPGTGYVYVGLTDMETEGSFVTNDNSRYLSDMEFDAWEPGQPDNGDGNGYEDCLALHHNGTMFDVACDLELPFLCEKRAP